MKTIRYMGGALVLVGFGFSWAAGAGCSVTTVDPPDGSADASPDGSVDPIPDAAPDAPVCTGTKPVCITAYCNDVIKPELDYDPVCVSAGWKCPGGTMPMSECRCGLPPRGDCLNDGGADGSADATAD